MNLGPAVGTVVGSVVAVPLVGVALVAIEIVESAVGQRVSGLLCSRRQGTQKEQHCQEQV